MKVAVFSFFLCVIFISSCKKSSDIVNMSPANQDCTLEGFSCGSSVQFVFRPHINLNYVSLNSRLYYGNDTINGLNYGSSTFDTNKVIIKLDNRGRIPLNNYDTAKLYYHYTLSCGIRKLADTVKIPTMVKIFDGNNKCILRYSDFKFKFQTGKINNGKTGNCYEEITCVFDKGATYRLNGIERTEKTIYLD